MQRIIGINYQTLIFVNYAHLSIMNNPTLQSDRYLEEKKIVSFFSHIPIQYQNQKSIPCLLYPYNTTYCSCFLLPCIFSPNNYFSSYSSSDLLLTHLQNSISTCLLPYIILSFLLFFLFSLLIIILLKNKTK